MSKKYDRVYQFKITLKGIKPPIWRRIKVSETYTFWDLHVAIQDSMGWTDTHLHHFEIKNPATGMREEIGIPDEDFIDMTIRPGWKWEIANYFSSQNDKAEYIYDYGDDWEHSIKLEKIFQRNEGIEYPVCTGGARACPPEDCGGIWGYQDFLEAIMDPKNPQHEEMLDWIGGDFDPESFDAKDVIFDDPKKRLKYAMSE
ncbi:MAG: plasmid pRiA4b ORF-3 family protein [Nitrospirota bacterium]